MISVQNRQLRLSGSKWLAGIALVWLVAACTPKVRVLRGTGNTPPPKKEQPAAKEKTEKIEEKAAAVDVNNIALLLPFELNKANPHAPSTEDIRRSALALDFYQGFKLGLDALAEKGSHFRLNVLDTRDDIAENTRIAKLEAVQDAALVVGPVYPKEIRVFGFNASLDSALQISPLAASAPGEFNMPNLVTVTAPLDAHVRALATDIAQRYQSGDVVILYDTQDAASRQFLSPLRAEIGRINKNIKVTQVQDEQTLESSVHLSGKNLVVLATTNKYQISPALAHLRRLQEEFSYQIQLFGHPNWAKLAFDDTDGLEQFQTCITSSYYVDDSRDEVRRFNDRYRQAFGVAPSEFAYKGYDAAYFFGGLLAEYGTDYKAHVTEADYKGLHNTFEFEYNPDWGYVNSAISILRFRGGTFRPLK